MSIRRLTAEDFHAAVEATPILVVEFAEQERESGAHPLAARFPETRFARLDPLKEPDISRMFDLAGPIGTLIFRERVVLYCEAIALTTERLAQMLESVATLDMDTIHRDLARKRSEVAVHMQRMCPAARRGR